MRAHTHIIYICADRYTSNMYIIIYQIYTFPRKHMNKFQCEERPTGTSHRNLHSPSLSLSPLAGSSGMQQICTVHGQTKANAKLVFTSWPIPFSTTGSEFVDFYCWRRMTLALDFSEELGKVSATPRLLHWRLVKLKRRQWSIVKSHHNMKPQPA